MAARSYLEVRLAAVSLTACFWLLSDFCEISLTLDAAASSRRRGYHRPDIRIGSLLRSSKQLSSGLVPSRIEEATPCCCQPDEDDQPNGANTAHDARSATYHGHSAYRDIFEAIYQGILGARAFAGDDSGSQPDGFSATTGTAVERPARHTARITCA